MTGVGAAVGRVDKFFDDFWFSLFILSCEILR
jgi:hypothetical protein